MKKLIVDTKGLACPQPVINTKKALEAKDFDELTILIDNDVALANVKRLINKMGFNVTSEEKIDEIYNLIIKNDDTNTSDKVQVEVQKASGKTILFLTDKLGRGNDELGELLMNGFVYALTEADKTPHKLLFMNSSVNLCVEGAESLKNLKKLDEMGVEILVCGTCLNFFNVADKLAVGRVSNMYDITEGMLDKQELITIS
jgi:selenium metabolism protein YedF